MGGRADRRDERAGAGRRVPGHGGRALALLALLLIAALGACNLAPAVPTATPDPEPAPTAATAEAPPAPVAPAPGQVGGRLLFVRGGNVWAWAGAQAFQLTTEGNYAQPRWSPDGTAMIYLRRGESFVDLWQADGNGKPVRQITNNQAKGLVPESKDYVDASYLVTGPTWARTTSGGDRIVYSTDRDSRLFQLWLANGLTGKPAPIYAVQGLAVHQEGAVLSPDGMNVAFTADTYDQKTGAHATQIYVVDVNTGSYRALTSEASGAYDAAWSPDGKWLTYAVRQSKDATGLWAIRADGSGRQRITDGAKDRGATWDPDGGHLAFVRAQGAGFGLYSMPIDTSGAALAPGKPERIGDFTDVDPASGVSWSR